KEGITCLFDLRRSRGLPLPLVIMSTVVCESTTDVVEKAYVVARRRGAFMLNYNFRYFMPESAGLAYEKHLKEVFGLQSSGAWRGWIVPEYEKKDYREGADKVRRLLRAKRFKLRPPYVVSGPSQLRGQDYDKWFNDFL